MPVLIKPGRGVRCFLFKAAAICCIGKTVSFGLRFSGIDCFRSNLLTVFRTDAKSCLGFSGFGFGFGRGRGFCATCLGVGFAGFLNLGFGLCGISALGFGVFFNLGLGFGTGTDSGDDFIMGSGFEATCGLADGGGGAGFFLTMISDFSSGFCNSVAISTSNTCSGAIIGSVEGNTLSQPIRKTAT